jgi:ubiquitin-protein ligase
MDQHTHRNQHEKGIEMFPATRSVSDTVQGEHQEQFDPLCWTATIRGYDETPWEGGVFRVELCFPLEYDQRPPQVRFLTIPFHPNGTANMKVN